MFRPSFLRRHPFLALLHSIISLSLFDTLYSFVAIAQGALLADTTRGMQQDRARIARHTAWISLVGGGFATQCTAWVWNRSVGPILHSGGTGALRVDDALARFRWYCFAVACLSATGFAWSTRNLPDILSAKRFDEDAPHSGPPGVPAPAPRISLSAFIREILGHANFWFFLGMNVLQESLAVFLGQFQHLWVELLLGAHWTSFARALLLSAVSVAAGLLQIALNQCSASKHGTHAIYTRAFQLRLCAIGLALVGCLLFNPHAFHFVHFQVDPKADPDADAPWLVPPHASWRATAMGWVIASALAVTSLSVFMPLGFFPLTMGLLVDEHRASLPLQVRRARPSVASLFMGTHALFAKPLDSVGPMVGSLLLKRAGARAAPAAPLSPSPSTLPLASPPLPSACSPEPVVSAPVATPALTPTHAARAALPATSPHHQRACWQMLVLLPLAPTLVQMAIWRWFSLRGERRIAEIKRTLEEEGVEDGTDVV